MASTSSFLCSPILSFNPIQVTKSNPNKNVCTKIFVMRSQEAHNHNYNHRLVDDNLIVLRKRIHKMKMIETNYKPPMEWMGWEKKFYPRYDSIICDAMGLLQSYLMESRPSMALGLIALIALSLPASTAVVMFNLLELPKGVLVHLG